MRPIRRRYRLGMPGLIYIGVTLLLGLGALNSDNNLLYLAFGFAVAAMATSGLVSGAMMMGVRLERQSPDAGFVGQPLPIAYISWSQSRFVPAFGLLIEESRSSIKGVKPNWRKHMPGPRSYVAHVGPRERVQSRASVVPTKRGVCRLSGVRLSSTFPFGIFRKSVVIPAARTIEVYPEIREIRRELLRRVMSTGAFDAAASSRRGIGDEFYGLREYRAGDSLRHIAWRASAKLGDVVIREHLSMMSGQVWIVLDLNITDPQSEDQIDKLERAISLAASLALDALTQGTVVGLIAPAQGVVRPPSSGTRHRRELLGVLARIEPLALGSDQRVGDQALAQLIQRAPCLVIHAGDLDPSVGPGGASHLTADDLDRLTREADGFASETEAIDAGEMNAIAEVSR